MPSLDITPASPAEPPLRCGQPVHVNVRTSWLPAVVIWLAPGRVGIAFQTPQPSLAAVTTPWTVRPAARARLVPARHLVTGDQVLAADGRVFTVACPPWRGRSGALLVAYRDGSRAVLAPTAILRVADTTPQVTVRGVPL